MLNELEVKHIDFLLSVMNEIENEEDNDFRLYKSIDDSGIDLAF